jgi:hypothetical protein
MVQKKNYDIICNWLQPISNHEFNRAGWILCNKIYILVSLRSRNESNMLWVLTEINVIIYKFVILTNVSILVITLPRSEYNSFIISLPPIDMSSTEMPWGEMIRREARGINDDDLGEVQGIDQDTVTTTAGVVDKITYHLPKSLVDRYDGHNLWFKITKEEAKTKYGMD